MKQWLESVYSDGTKYFVSNPLPAKKDTVQIQIRFYEDAPVGHVFLRTKINGTEQLFKMQQSKDLCEFFKVFHLLLYLMNSNLFYISKDHLCKFIKAPVEKHR